MINLSRQQLFVVLIVTLLVMLLLGFLVGRFVVNQWVTVPDLTGKTLYDAIRAIEQAGLVFVGSIELANDTIFASRVIASSPPADIEVPRGSPVTLMVSNGPHFIRYAKQGGSDSGDCITWGDACNLQHALDKAKAGDEIWVETGVHKPGTVRTDTFRLSKGVALYGGFLGIETSRDQRDWKYNITILSGDIDGNDLTDANGVITTTANITGTNSYHVVTGSETDATAILDGFTITGGQANGTKSGRCGPACGGGMYNERGSPTLANVVFSGNFAKQAGGGMWNYESSSPNLTNVSFIGNTATTHGGGMCNDTRSNPTLTNVTFSGNFAQQAGGGMWNYESSSPNLTNVSFIGNTATTDGGGMCNDTGSNPTLTNVTFISNEAKRNGGGMYNVSSNPTLTNVTFGRNSATKKNGGGMYNHASSPKLTNCILGGNKAGLYGPQIHNHQGSRPNILYSLVQDGCPPDATCTDHVLTADPQFVDAANGDLRLEHTSERTSPAIDAGLDSAVPAGVTTDLDGKPRFCGERVDMGAYEYQKNCPQE
jgi:predicted outer membrane repeat protein